MLCDKEVLHYLNLYEFSLLNYIIHFSMSVENYSDSSTDSTIKELKRVFFTRLAFGLYKI